MAHVFPRKLDQNDQPIEAESINTNIQQVVQEVSGRLNEQNLRGHATVPAERFVPNYTEVEASSVLNVHRNGWIVEVQGLGDGGGFFSNAGDPDLDNAFKVSVNNDWAKVANMDVTIQTGGSTLWAMASFQQLCVGQWALTGSTSAPHPADADKFNGIQYAIALDGSVLHDSILGGADRMNDPFGEAWNALNHSFVTDITFQVTPGTHEVALYARFCLPHDFQTKVFTTNTYMLVCNRELIVMEMK
tara:strand:+ start:15590 stop:16327 length:738 start_codon:yes stop_codon:yes gene_type:complete